MDNARAPNELNVKLVWLTVFRTVTTSLLLAATAVPILARPVTEDLSSQESLSFGVIAAVYALTLVYGIALRRGRVGAVGVYVQVLGDVLLATALVYLTGGVESPFTFTFSLAVISAAIVLDQRGALVAATASAGAFGALGLLSRSGVLQSPGVAGSVSTGRFVFLLGTALLAQFLIAILASYLSRQIALAGGALRQREADLRRLAQLQEQVLAAMPSGLVTCDPKGRVTFINRAGRAILGLPMEGTVERVVDEVFPRLHRLDVRTRRRNELVVDTSEGERTLGLSVAALEPSSEGSLIVFQDLTELRRVERELRRVDRLAALGTFSAQLAHEIRNPLASMRGAAQLLAEEGEGGAQHTRLTTILVREADRLSALVENFLRFARPPEPQLARVDLAPIITEALEMTRLDKLSEGVVLESRLEHVEAPVDSSQLKQVLLNLLRNAVAAAHPNGQVKVLLDVADASARIRVWDSAGAIREENLGRIFEPFFTTRQGGTGLGLSTAHSIIHAHQGQIHVSSSPAKGTEFILELPIREARLESAGR